MVQQAPWPARSRARKQLGASEGAYIQGTTGRRYAEKRLGHSLGLTALGPTRRWCTHRRENRTASDGAQPSSYGRPARLGRAPRRQACARRAQACAQQAVHQATQPDCRRREMAARRHSPRQHRHRRTAWPAAVSAHANRVHGSEGFGRDWTAHLPAAQPMADQAQALPDRTPRRAAGGTPRRTSRFDIGCALCPRLDVRPPMNDDMGAPLLQSSWSATGGWLAKTGPPVTLFVSRADTTPTLHLR